MVLIAPSWGPTCLLETCGTEVTGVLLDAGYEVIVRPHPMTSRKTPGAVPALVAAHGRHPRFNLDTGIAAQHSLHRSDVMVSDWSGAALEYAFGLERPVIFIDVPRKVNNPRYGELGIEPFEVTVRDKIGSVVPPGDLGALPAAIDAILERGDDLVEQIRTVRDRNIFNVGRSGRVAAEVIAAKAERYMSRIGSGTAPAVEKGC